MKSRKNGRVGWWKGGRFLVLFKRERDRLDSRFYLSVYDVDQGNEGTEWNLDFLA